MKPSPADAVPADAIVVSDVAATSGDPLRLAVSNTSFVDALFAECLTAEEIAPDALRAYFVQFYLAQMDNGGFAQFVYNSRWDHNVVARVRDGLRTIGARMHQAVFLEGVAVVRHIGPDALDVFLAHDFWEGGPERDHLDAVTIQYAKAAEVEDLAARTAGWIRTHPKLRVLTREQMDAEVRRRAAAVPDMPERLAAARALEPRPAKLIRVLCAVAGQELQQIVAGDPTHEHDGQTVIAWHFLTDRGHHFMVEDGGRAMMFTADAPGRPICELTGIDERAGDDGRDPAL